MKALEAEIAARVAQFQADAEYLADNGGADLRAAALADILAMGSDYGGAYPDANDTGGKQWRAWRAIYKQAEQLQ